MVIRNTNSSVTYDVTTRLDALGTPEPHLFLCEIIAGVDPRGARGALHAAVVRALDTEDARGLPEADAWAVVRDIVLGNPCYQGEWVSLADSIAAARELMQYLHPKLKSSEVTAKITGTLGHVALTPSEIDEFNRRFLHDF